MAVRHLDLSQESAGPTGDGRPVLTVFWWRDLPLGLLAGTADEVPFSRAALDALVARFAAEQRATRDPSIGAPLWSDPQGLPRRSLSVPAAIACDETLAWLDRLASDAPPTAEDLSVIVCTRHRGEALARCLAGLAGQQRPAGELIVVDNAPDPEVQEICAAFPSVRYLHEPRQGLSHARNAGILAASRSLVAFTDDDVEPHPKWTGEVVRAFSDKEVDAVTGLVLPTRLDTEAQAFFQMSMGGFGARCVPVRFGQAFYQEAPDSAPEVWRIGAGANMAFRRSIFARVGLFDPRLGAGASGCSEDSELWYRIVAMGGVCQYEPRAVVFHDHRAEWNELRRQMRAYLNGHVSALVAQADRFRDARNLRRIYRQLPAYYLRHLIRTLQLGETERRQILGEEFIGWVTGLRYIVDRRWRRAAPALPSQVGERA